MNPRHLAALSLFLLFAPAGVMRVAASPQAAQHFDAKLFQELRWRSIGPSRGGRALAVAGVRGQPEVYYFGSVGGGIWKTDDAGRTWNPIFDSQPIASIGAIAVAPSDSNMIYASLWQTRRPPWSVYPPSNGPGCGLYRSSDGDDHWERASGQGLPTEGLGRIGVVFAPSNPRRIYLIVDAKEGGLFRSDNSGQSWQRVSNDRRIWQRGWYFGEVSVDPKDPDTVYVPNTTTYQSRDGGKTFTALKGAPGGDDYHELWIDPDEPRRMILSSDQGTIVTRNGGETWSSWFNQPTGQFYHVATDNQFPYWVYGAQQDSGSAATPSRSKYRSLNFHDWRPMDAGDENGYIAPDPLNPGVVFGGFVARQDFGDEQLQHLPPTLAHPGGYRRTWTLPLVFSPIDPHVLYFGSQVLFRTGDGGSSWQAISPDLTREDPGVPPNLDAATAADAPKGKRHGVIYTIGPSFVRAGEIWAGTDDGLIQLTQDEGKTWENVTPPELTPWSKVTHIEASHFDAGTAYKCDASMCVTLLQ